MKKAPQTLYAQEFEMLVTMPQTGIEPVRGLTLAGF